MTAFLRLEDEAGNAVALDYADGPEESPSGLESEGGPATGLNNAEVREQERQAGERYEEEGEDDEEEEEKKRKFGDGLHRGKFKSLFGGGRSNSKEIDSTSTTSTTTSTPASIPSSSTQGPHAVHSDPGRPTNLAKRTLYTANVGDARAVLW